MLDQVQHQSQMLADKQTSAFEWNQFVEPMSLMNLNDLDESNLLEMLQILTKRRDELRLIDKQLFDLIAECFVRLKPNAAFNAGSTGPNSCSDSSSGFGDGGNSSLAGSLDDGAIDLSSRLAEVETAAKLPPSHSSTNQTADQQEQQQQQQQQQRPTNNKRSNLASPSLHFKKQRLLSAIISTDDIGEKQQVLAEKELDVRNDDDDALGNRNLTVDGQQAPSVKLIACNLTSSYQQLNPIGNQQNQDEYQQQLKYQHQLQFHAGPIRPTIQQQASLVVSSASAAAAAAAGVIQSQRQPFEQQFDSGNNSSASDQDEDDRQSQADDCNERPQLKKFCSIGTAEMSFERFSRQQNLINSTLATLANSTQNTNSNQTQRQLAPANHQNELCAAAAAAAIKPTGANCFSLELATSSSATLGKAQHQQPAAGHLVSPMMMTRLAATGHHQHHQLVQQQPVQQADFMHTLYDQFIRKSHTVAQSHLLEPVASFHQQTIVPLALTQNQSALFNSTTLHQAQMGAIPAPICVGTSKAMEVAAQSVAQSSSSSSSSSSSLAFERLLVSAKELGPIVRKMSFRCHVCSSCFEDRHRLQQHLSIHLNLHPSWFEEKTIKETMAQYEMRRGDYLCQSCQLRFETTTEFDKHMHLHGEKPHQCELCTQDNKSVSFRYFRQLLTHLRSHCFLYSCRFVPECRQTANRKDYLKLHILKHHLNNKLPEQYTVCCH